VKIPLASFVRAQQNQKNLIRLHCIVLFFMQSNCITLAAEHVTYITILSQ